MRSTLDEDEVILDIVRGLLRAEDVYARQAPSGGANIAMTILLKLFVRSEEGRVECVKQLLTGIGTSATGALRRIESLKAAGLVRRARDQTDGRRVLVTLTERGRRLVIDIAEQVRAASRSEAAARRQSSADHVVTFA